MPELAIRDASPPDLEAIFAMYNREVVNGTATWDEDVVTPREQRAWLAEHAGPYCAIVAERAGEVVGWGSLSAYRPKAGYRLTAEDTVYVRPDNFRRGVGSALLRELVQRALESGFHVLVAKIGGDNLASIELHGRAGFVHCGVEREVGRKFGRWLDLTSMQLILER